MISHKSIIRLNCLLISLTVASSSFADVATTPGNMMPTPRLGVGTTAPEDGVNPGIKLPPLPPKNPALKSPGPGRMASPTMQALDKTAFPNMTCPLTDNRPHKDLLTAISALNQVVIVTPECKNNADLAKMSEQTKKMMEAGKSLSTLWQNPTTIKDDPSSINTFHGNLGTMIEGVTTLTQTLESNTLMNNKCGREMMSTGGALMAVADVVTPLAPFALVGASMNPSLGIALPYILGVTGIGSVTKVIKKMKDDDTLDMDRPEHRNAVLQNICEYSKIAQRVRFLKLAQSGQLEQVTLEIQNMEKSTLAMLNGSSNERILAISRIRTDISKQLSQANEIVTKDHAELRALVNQLGDKSDDNVMCLTARELVESSIDNNSFPGRTIKNFETVVGLQQNVTISQRAIQKSEERFRQVLKDNLKDLSNKGIKQCASFGRSYFEALTRVIQSTRSAISRLSSNLDQELNRDSEYSVFRRKEVLARQELQDMSKIVSILDRLNMDNAVIDKMEMDVQMNGLKRALFGSKFAGGDSPAMAWLDFVDENHDRAISQFNTEMKALLQDAYQLTSIGRIDFYRRDTNGEILKDRFGYMQRMSPQEINERVMKDVRSVSDLSVLTAKTVENNPEAQGAVCQRLESIWLAWDSAMFHLAAEEFFCQNIKSFFDTDVQKSLVSRCVDQMTLNGKVTRASDIKAKRTKLSSQGYNANALLVSSKMKELSCQMPDSNILK